MIPLDASERRLAELAAHELAHAAENDQLASDAVMRAVPLHAIVLLARAHLELLGDLREIQAHGAHGGIEAALITIARQGSRLAAEILGAGFTEEKHPASVTAPRLVRDPAALSEADLITLYCEVMRETEGVFVKYESYIVRLWDGMDGCWTDCTGAVSREVALRDWAARTNGGAQRVSFAEIDYYRIFPGDTRMLWDGSDGREMHR